MGNKKGKKFLLLFFVPLALAASLWFDRETPAVESEWPIEVSSPEGKILLYQPQPDSLKDDKLTGRSAVSFTPSGGEAPVFGAFWFDARISTDRDERLVTMREMNILQAKFPHAASDLERIIIQALQNEVPRMNITFSLDRLLTSLEEAEKAQVSSENLKTDPPKIIFTETPSVLVTIDGLPQLRPMPDTKVMQVVNTPFVLLFDPSLKAYYLKGGGEWFSAKDVLGPWQGDPNPPESILAIPLREMEKERDPAPPKQVLRSKMEKVIVATEPTELIVASGRPRYMPIQGTDLLFISNTSSDVFLEIGSQNYYVVLAGRWYQSASLQGPWTYVPANQLPSGFAKIPPASPKGNVLVYVAGTQQAKEAVLDAGIPQTASIKRNTTLNVTYDGPPKFEAIEGTNLRYAVNSPYAVVESQDRFYSCHQGVWYAANDPSGPWTVATQVPDEIYSIPPSSPLYNVRYVRVFDYTPDVVYAGYYPGYLGWYVYGPTVVYGSGWYYPGWLGPAYYYPYPWTWGFGFHYNPYAGWSFGFNYGYVGAGAWIGFGVGSGWGGGGRWWGPHGYHPPVGVHYGRYNSSVNAARGGSAYHPYPHRKDYYYRNNIYNHRDNLARRADGGQTALAMQQRAAQGKGNDVYTDRAGNIHRYSKNGWERRDSGGWTKSGPQNELSPTTKASPRQGGPERARSFEGKRAPGAGKEAGPGVARRSPAPLDREQFARQRGAERANSFQSFRGTSGEPIAQNRSLGGGNWPSSRNLQGGGGSGGFFRGSERAFQGGNWPSSRSFQGDGGSGGSFMGSGRGFQGGNSIGGSAGRGGGHGRSR